MLAVQAAPNTQTTEITSKQRSEATRCWQETWQKVAAATASSITTAVTATALASAHMLSCTLFIVKALQLVASRRYPPVLDYYYHPHIANVGLSRWRAPVLLQNAASSMCQLHGLGFRACIWYLTDAAFCNRTDALHLSIPILAIWRWQ